MSLLRKFNLVNQFNMTYLAGTAFLNVVLIILLMLRMTHWNCLMHLKHRIAIQLNMKLYLS